jgi:hypothetical protein
LEAALPAIIEEEIAVLERLERLPDSAAVSIKNAALLSGISDQRRQEGRERGPPPQADPRRARPDRRLERETPPLAGRRSCFRISKIKDQR